NNSRAIKISPITKSSSQSSQSLPRPSSLQKEITDDSYSSSSSASTMKPSASTKESSTETPKQYLERLQYTLSKSKLATMLAKRSNAFHQSALKAYMEIFDFEKNPIDIAL
ncbi:1001_t:CDS:2, partial [Diversispora eburnea]